MMDNRKLSNEELEQVHGGLDSQTEIDTIMQQGLDSGTESCPDYVESMSSYTTVQSTEKKLYDCCIKCSYYAGTYCKKGNF